MRTQKNNALLDEWREPVQHDSKLADGTTILLLSIPVALGLGIVVGHALPLTWFAGLH